MISDTLILVVLLLIVIALIVLSRAFYRRKMLSFEISRKILHIGAVGVSAFAVMLESQIVLLTWIVGFMLPVLYILIKRGFYQNLETGYRSWGIFYYALAYFGLLLFFKNNLSVVFYSMLTLAVADGFAAITGELYGHHKFDTSEMTKTWEGSIVFLFGCIFCLGVVPVWFPHFGTPIESLPAILIVSLALTMGESLFENGTDNLIIPFLLVYWMCIDLQFITFAHVAGAIGMVGFGVLANRYEALSFSGSIAAVLMGLVLVISPIPIWTVPAVILFAVGTILSKMPGGQNGKDSQRDCRQVMANGAVPTISLLVYMASGNAAFLFASMAGYAAALSDTASSEIGTRFKLKTYSILTFRPVPVGLSGGVSSIGLVAGLIFSLLIAAVALYISRHLTHYYFLLLGLAGFVGNLVDSILGDKWQYKYRLEADGSWYEQGDDSHALETRGLRWMNNNMVNFISVSCGSLAGFLIFYFL